MSGEEYLDEISEDDREFYGFRELDYANLHLYRVLRPDESVETGIYCKDKTSTRTVVQHIASGSRYPSKYISTTLDIKKAAKWAFYDMDTDDRRLRDTPLRVVRIDIQVLAGTATEKRCINLCDKEVLKHFIGGATHKNWAKSEVLFTYEIPKFVCKTTEIQEGMACYAYATPPDIIDRLTSSDNVVPKTQVYYFERLEQPKQPKEKKRKKTTLEDDMSKLSI